MNTKNIHIDHGTHSNHADLTTKAVSFITTLCKKAPALFIRSELEKAQAGYRRKQLRESSIQQDIVSSMPLKTKLGLGMYRWID
jgi:hypothetical protein